MDRGADVGPLRRLGAAVVVDGDFGGHVGEIIGSAELGGGVVGVVGAVVVGAVVVTDRRGQPN